MTISSGGVMDSGKGMMLKLVKPEWHVWQWRSARDFEVIELDIESELFYDLSAPA
jgi:hypothetical protein